MRGRQKVFKITVAYASYSALERLELWDDLEHITNICQGPWLVRGDFNVIMDKSEKLGCIPVTQQEICDFIQCENYHSLN